MPREIAHFLAIDHLVENLPGLKTLVLGQKLGLEALYLGSITPDSPYYMPIGNSEDVAEFIHGRSGNDTFVVLRHLMALCDSLTKEQGGMLTLFATGILTHIIMDAVMHPFINLLSGDYYARDAIERKKARTLHRRLETDLDFYLLRSSRPKYLSLLELRSNLGGNLGELSKSMDYVLRENGHESSYKLYWLSHALLYSLFDKKFIGNLNFLPTEINALCGQGRELHELFKSKRQYPLGKSLYFKHEGTDLDLDFLYNLALEFLLKEVALFVRDSPKYLSLHGPSLVDGTVQ